jgi:hypothetical protein
LGSVNPARGGIVGKDYELFWSIGALQNIKFQAPNYKQISNSNSDHTLNSA